MTPPRPYRAMYAYTWDIAETDPAAFEDELAGIGINTVAVAAAYHAGKFIRPKGRSGKVYFPEDGVAHCRIDPAKFKDIKPDIGQLAGQNDVLATLCQRGTMAVSAWTVVLHNSRLGARHCEAATRNACGDVLHYSLCPSSPQARDYAVTLCAEIADTYAVSGLTLETPGWLPYGHGYHHEFALIGEAPRLEFYLGLCFCAHCKRSANAAGIDTGALQERVLSRIGSELAAAEEPHPQADRLWLEREILMDAELAAFLRWRTGVVTSLVAEIRAAVRKDATLHVIPSVQQPLALAWIEGTDLAALDAACDGLEVCLYSAAALTDQAMISAEIGRTDWRCVMRPTSPEHRSEASFAGTLQGLAAAGIADFAFYNYGHMRQSGLARIGRALATV